MEHKERLKRAGIAKHGSEAKWREFQRQSANKSSRNSKGTGGFNHMSRTDPERLKQISSEAGKKYVLKESKTTTSKETDSKKA